MLFLTGRGLVLVEAGAVAVARLDGMLYRQKWEPSYNVDVLYTIQFSKRYCYLLKSTSIDCRHDIFDRGR